MVYLLGDHIRNSEKVRIFLVELKKHNKFCNKITKKCFLFKIMFKNYFLFFDKNKKKWS